MNTLTLQLRVKNEEGALLRVLGMARRRRFDLVNINADTSADGHYMNVKMTVKAERSAPAFVRQIEKLVDVDRVIMVESAAESNASAAG